MFIILNDSELEQRDSEVAGNSLIVYEGVTDGEGSMAIVRPPYGKCVPLRLITVGHTDSTQLGDIRSWFPSPEAKVPAATITTTDNPRKCGMWSDFSDRHQVESFVHLPRGLCSSGTKR